MKDKKILKEAAKHYAENEIKDRGTDDDKLICSIDFIAGAQWQQEQILDFLYEEITERRDYSASKMCEKVIEFIEQFKNK